MVLRFFTSLRYVQNDMEEGFVQNDMEGGAPFVLRAFPSLMGETLPLCPGHTPLTRFARARPFRFAKGAVGFY